MALTMQAQEIEESLAFMTEELHFTSAQLEKALPALTRGPRNFVRDLQGIFPDKSYAEVCGDSKLAARYNLCISGWESAYSSLHSCLEQ